MHLDHLRFRRYLDAFVDGELDGGLRSKVSDHVAVCPMCGRDAELTIHLKHSLARGTFTDRVRRWVHLCNKLT